MIRPMMDKLINLLGGYTKLQYDVLEQVQNAAELKISILDKEISTLKLEHDKSKQWLNLALEDYDKIYEKYKALTPHVSTESESLINYYELKYPAKPIYYKGMAIQTKKYGTLKANCLVSDYITITKGMINWLKDRGLMYDGNGTPEELSKHAWEVYTEFVRYTRYLTDNELYGIAENWVPNMMQFYTKYNGKWIADCFTGDTKIIVYDTLTKSYDHVEISKLNLNRHMAVSYNEVTNEVEFKPILNVVNKGKRPVFNVKMNQGGSFRSTSDHKIACYVNPNKDPKIKYKPLSEFKLEKSKKGSNQIPTLIKLPELNSYNCDEDYLKLQGIYVADGYAKSNSSFCIAGDTPQFVEENKEVLDNLELEYTFNDRPAHKYYNVLDSDYGSDWGKVGTFKQFDNNITGLTNDQIKVLLKPYLERDAYIIGKTKDSGNRNWELTDKYIMATVSKELAKQLHLLHLILGKPVIQYVDEYQYPDANRQPVHRLRTKTNAKEYLPNLSAKTIKSVTEEGLEDVYDIEVADNHNFFLAESNILVHNCENVANLCAGLIIGSGVPAGFVRVTAGNTNTGGGHASLTVWDHRTGGFEQWETTSRDPMLVKHDDDIYISRVWFSYNNKNSWSTKPKEKYEKIK